MKLKRISNIVKYGLGPEARERKRADKEKRREERFWQNEQWQRGEALAKRSYDSYEAYLEHQSSKLDNIVDRLRENEDEEFARFRERFESCEALAEARSVLCLGARLGTEVRALHSLGYFAVGIDLNPGRDNPYVLPGDFHAIVFPDNSVDAIYTNCMDHVFDLEKVIAETRRLLRPNGLFLVEIEVGFEEGYLPGEYEATHWPRAEDLIKRISELGDYRQESSRDVGVSRRAPRLQVLFRKAV